jgi:hypothetical protein
MEIRYRVREVVVVMAPPTKGLGSNRRPILRRFWDMAATKDDARGKMTSKSFHSPPPSPRYKMNHTPAIVRSVPP